MFSSDGITVARILGIRVVIDTSWLFIFALVVWSLAAGYFPMVLPGVGAGAAWLLGLVAGFLLFGSVLVHEISHALFARRAGIEVPRIRLFLFGGVSEMASEPRDPRAEMRIAMAGPLTSLGLAAGLWILALTPLLVPFPGAHAIVIYLAAVNLALGIFNLLPGFPLDGGRMLRAWLWSRHGNLLRATRTAGRAGSVLGYALMGLGLLQLVGGHIIRGVWSILIGMFLNQAASASYRTVLLRDRLAGVRVSQLMSQPVIAVPDHASLEDLVNDFFYRHPHGSFPVVSGDRLAGMVSLDQVKAVSREEWPRVPVRRVMTSETEVGPLAPADDCVAALERMIREGVGRLPVVEGGRLVGILSHRDVMQLFQIRSDLAS